MKKPVAAAIRSALPLTQRQERGADPILACNLCGEPVDPSDLACSVWREHDEYDHPIPGTGALVFLGRGSAHAACKRQLEEHPRLYAEETGEPGSFPRICGGCEHRRYEGREGNRCTHPDGKRNGGPGLLVMLEGALPAGMIVCTRGGRARPVRHAVSCPGRSTKVDDGRKGRGT